MRTNWKKKYKELEVKLARTERDLRIATKKHTFNDIIWLSLEENLPLINIKKMNNEFNRIIKRLTK